MTNMWANMPRPKKYMSLLLFTENLCVDSGKLRALDIRTLTFTPDYLQLLSIWRWFGFLGPGQAYQVHFYLRVDHTAATDYRFHHLYNYLILLLYHHFQTKKNSVNCQIVHASFEHLVYIVGAGHQLFPLLSVMQIIVIRRNLMSKKKHFASHLWERKKEHRHCN